MFYFMVFRGQCSFEKVYREGQIKILEGGVKPNDYSITVLDRGGGSSQMITVDYIGGRGVSENPKTDYVILEQPLRCPTFMINFNVTKE